jgi:UDP-N-acetyl-D-galactosamine dehydrogenase
VAKPHEVREEYGVELCDLTKVDRVDAVVAAVSHKQILDIRLADLAKKAGNGAPFVDVKSAFDRAALEAAGFRVWRL